MTSVSTERYTVPGFTGALLQAEDAGYDAARKVFNGMIDRRPAVIARCRTADDVAAAIRFARAEGLPISVYGGGHAVTGAAVVDGGVCIDLRGMKGISVNAGRIPGQMGGVKAGQ